ncbi:hypothetical protein [Streptomyces sp. NPDC007205]|uniref:LppU/SCO3897 family protein n=1 Tax=Streptomyces sp. NPDC007205 TaxID=3154316 RepID=UPI0033ED9BA6
MSTPPPPHPAYQQNPYQQNPYQPNSGPYEQAPGGYGQAPYPQAPGAYPSAPGAYPSAPGAGCEVCGAAPATAVTIRGHQGFLVIMRQLRRRGTFCHPCALAVFRKMQSDTMAQGWWGPMSMFITPITLLINLFALSRIRRLPAPAAAQRPGLDPGKPVFKRPTGLVGLVPLTGFVLMLVAVPVLILIASSADDSGSGAAFHPTKSAAPLSAGECAHNDGTLTRWDLKKVSCDAADAQYLVKDPKDGICASGEYVADIEYGTDQMTTLCLRPVK